MFGKKKCIVCNKAIESLVDQVNYNLKQWGGKNIGKFDIHADIECFIEGSKILKNQIYNSHSHGFTEAKGLVDGMNYSFRLCRNQDGFDFVIYFTNQYGRQIPDKTNRKFFELCRYSESIMLVLIEKFRGTPEFTIPKLVSVKDPMLNQEYLESDEYKKIVSDAKREYNTSVKVKGDGGVEGLNALCIRVCKTILVI